MKNNSKNIYFEYSLNIYIYNIHVKNQYYSSN